MLLVVRLLQLLLLNFSFVIQIKVKMMQKHVQETEKDLKNSVIQLKQDREVCNVTW